MLSDRFCLKLAQHTKGAADRAVKRKNSRSGIGPDNHHYRSVKTPFVRIRNGEIAQVSTAALI